MFADAIAFVFLRCVLSAIAKLHVHLLQEWEERGEIWLMTYGVSKGSVRRRQWAENRDGMEVREINMHKNSPKTQHIWHLGTPLGGYRPVSYILESCFYGQQFHRR